MNSLAKFSGPDLYSSVEFTHPNIWEHQQHSGWSRLLIGAREREIALILDLCRDFTGPFAVLYVLVASRLGHDDGRHHLRVMSVVGEGQSIFDNHKMIYAYGDLHRYEAKLRGLGFSPGSVAIPGPHSHDYHAEFDRSEDEVMNYWEWKNFPLLAQNKGRPAFPSPPFMPTQCAVTSSLWRTS